MPVEAFQEGVVFLLCIRSRCCGNGTRRAPEHGLAKHTPEGGDSTFRGSGEEAADKAASIAPPPPFLFRNAIASSLKGCEGSLCAAALACRTTISTPAASPGLRSLTTQHAKWELQPGKRNADEKGVGKEARKSRERSAVSCAREEKWKRAG